MWQIAGMIAALLAALLAAVVVGMLPAGALRAWVSTVVPFAAFGAYSIFRSGPRGAIGAAVWIIAVVLGVSALVALV